MTMPLPHVPGVLSVEQVEQTADSIIEAQHSSGQIAWYAGGHTDPWDHVQAAMGLSAAGRRGEAVAAFDWLAAAQRADGSWATRYVGDTVEDPATDANFCAYIAAGVRHLWAMDPTGDLERFWSVIDRAMECVLSMRLPSGLVAWSRGEDGELSEQALVTGNASIAFSLRCALDLARVWGHQRPDWELAVARIDHALRAHLDWFTPKPRHSMDWYYPVLGGSLMGEAAHERIDERWDEFVVPGLGARCVTVNPWVTGGESCELVLALEAMGRRDDALRVFSEMQHLRDDDGSYWTGLVYSDGVRWPVERTTWTSGTVILAADALSAVTPAHDLFHPMRHVRTDWMVACPCQESLR
ncbi:prenyltransferase [Aeromicrobium sp. PE09-221]|uniref:prenyltransferase n=1 Tax=Aeromicrobium sp. PE09-221 TaxID=1898043 RepID=UPI0011223447|nr:prenyltransferase [Aeromicrobium sp. PE09-221]